MSTTNASKEVVYSYITKQGLFPFEITHQFMLDEINKDLPPRDRITLQQLRLAIDYLKNSGKIATKQLQFGLEITPFLNFEPKQKRQPKQKDDTLFTIKELGTIDFVVADYLERHCVGKANAQNAAKIIEGVNDILHDSHNGMCIPNDVDLRKHIKNIKQAGRFTRRINSDPSYGYWLALRCEHADVSYATKKNFESIKTDILNNTDIRLYFDFLNKLASQVNVDNQGRLVFNTEKDHIKVYSDDLR